MIEWKAVMSMNENKNHDETGIEIYKQVQQWRVVAQSTPAVTPQLNYALEEVIGEQVAHGKEPATIRLWRAEQAVVVAKKDIRTEKAQQAAELLGHVGWPVYVRQSGGTAVPHGEGTINLSLFLPRLPQMRWSIDLIYRALGLPFIRLFADKWGLQTTFGAVPGSFCDGDHNLVISQQKVAGTAQVWKGGPAGVSTSRPGYILAHITLLTHIERDLAMSTLNAFYEMSTGERPVKSETVARMADFITAPKKAELDQLLWDGLVETLTNMMNVVDLSAPRQEEWERAQHFMERTEPSYYRKERA
ncbi:hypothetical protein NXZ84_12385 [Mechercharimyces sp. CAU 1602]|nr:hypothetical protein [Mechercharimyces sp. CAU 1602]